MQSRTRFAQIYTALVANVVVTVAVVCKIGGNSHQSTGQLNKMTLNQI